MSRQGDKPRPDLTEAGYRKARREFLEHNRVCWLCGLPLDFDAPHRSKWSPTVDHMTPVSLGGDPKDRTQWRPAHHGCNSSRGNTLNQTTPLKASRYW